MNPDFSSRDVRLSSTLRGFFIAALIVAYGWLMRQPGASMTVGVLVAAALQLGVIAIRRLVRADHQAEALYIFELVADGVTVLLFALGVFGGTVNAGAI